MSDPHRKWSGVVVREYHLQVVEELKAKIGQLESEIVVLRGELSGSECDVAFWKERATAVDKESVKVKPPRLEGPVPLRRSRLAHHE